MPKDIFRHMADSMQSGMIRAFIMEELGQDRLLLHRCRKEVPTGRCLRWPVKTATTISIRPSLPIRVIPDPKTAGRVPRRFTWTPDLTTLSIPALFPPSKANGALATIW